jgi:hypothetical protein
MIIRIRWSTFFNKYIVEQEINGVVNAMWQYDASDVEYGDYLDIIEHLQSLGFKNDEIVLGNIWK